MTELIYVIYCTADNSLPIYIGKTKNLEQRWRQHKHCCTNENSAAYTYQVYQFIRENYGIEYWTIETLYTLDEDEDGSETEEYFINAVGMEGLLNTFHGQNYAMVKCEHGRRRSQCKECGGSQICIHNKFRNQCKDCEGSQICEHDRIRSRCKECGGSQICVHNRIRSQCKECSPYTCIDCNVTTSMGNRNRHLKTKKHVFNASNKSRICKTQMSLKNK